LASVISVIAVLIFSLTSSILLVIFSEILVSNLFSNSSVYLDYSSKLAEVFSSIAFNASEFLVRVSVAVANASEFLVISSFYAVKFSWREVVTSSLIFTDASSIDFDCSSFYLTSLSANFSKIFLSKSSLIYF